MVDKIFVLAGNVSTEDAMQATMQTPQFRKATRAMGFSYAAVKPIVDEIPALITTVHTASIGIVVGSSHGELDVTTQFLDCVAKSNIARPILFQNSLHNSTLGFLTVALGLTGSATTVSNGQFSGEDAINTALVLLRSGDCDICFALGYDLLVPAVESVRNRFYPHGLDRGQGAAALLLASETGVRNLNQTPKVEFINLEISNDRSPPVTCDQINQPFYDANGVAEFVKFIDKEPAKETLVLAKPNGGKSRFTIKRM